MKSGWEVKRLGEVCSFIRGPFGGSLKKNIFKEDGYAVYEQQHAIYDQFDKIRYFIDEKKFNEMKRFELNSGDLIMSCSGTMGKIAVVPKNIKQGIINQALLILSPSKKVSNIFLKLWMQSENFQDSLKKYSQGAAIQNVASVKILKEIEIPLPPLPEQQRIVAILDEAFAAIAKAKTNAEQNLKNAKELFESYLQSVFENKLHGSEFETLDSLCELIVDCEHKTAPIQETGYPSIRTPNIGKGVLILDGVNRVSEETYNEWTRRAIPQTDDLILAREAPAGNIGVIPENIKVCLGQRTVLIRPKKNKIISKFLAYLILSKDVQEQLLSHSTGATVEHINMKDIRAFKIFNISLITEQQTIVQKLDALLVETKQLEAIYQQKINDLDELKKSILQKAFAGELCYRL
ncbi:restriction endonuclease subunit S [Methylobacter psychrophilus]|uniref:restriction endonuclease subunit S n=1 Tax=Methylobacter psychrophilus TaxID=96941 RepID=UPI0021D4B280|nr:restriction endonuclease subunit S [Methylobacter psychrophilus]